MAHQMHLNKSGSGMASRTACGRNILRTPLSMKWADFKLLPEAQKCAKCAASKQVELNKRVDEKAESMDKIRELFEATRNADTPDDVFDTATSASENASDTVGFNNRHDANGRFTDQFIRVWMASVEGLLSSHDSATDTAREWFAARGVKW